jgi:hypothetical protein
VDPVRPARWGRRSSLLRGVGATIGLTTHPSGRPRRLRWLASLPKLVCIPCLAGDAANDDRMAAARIRIGRVALTGGGLAQTWLEATEDLRGEDIALPDRSPPRQVALG